MDNPGHDAVTGSGAGEPGGPRPIRPDAVLRVDQLRVTFDDRATGRPVRAVDDVSFSVRAGEVLALVGESGSGKSVTAQAVLGLLPASARATGSVQLTDAPTERPAHHQVNLIGQPERSWRGVRGRLASLVFQEPQSALNPVRSIGWQLSEAVRAHGHRSSEQVRGRVTELLDQVGLTAARARSYPHELSGGQKQRVVIALALAGEPSLLIADEPTTALDVTVQAEILQLLGSLRDRLGMAILLITHNMGVVADLADRVLVMRSGRMVERGEVVALFAGPFTEYTRELLAAVPRLPIAPAPTAAPEPERAASQSDRPAAVELLEASIGYPGRFGRATPAVLHDVNLAVRPGQVVGIVGESGSGKSTLGRAVSGSLVPTAGRLLVEGQEPAQLSRSQLRRLRRRIGVVHQDPATTLDPRLTIGDSIAEPLMVHRVASGPTLRSRVRQLLEDVALPTAYERRLPHELSGGQRQRVALARALALDPSVLIADEPTSALDVSVQAVILRLFTDLQAAYGFACLFISHDLAVVHEVSTRVVVLQSGRVVETGSSGSIFTDPQEDYTRRLLAAAPVPDPVEQRARTAGTGSRSLA